jgi:hypothetical protein
MLEASLVRDCFITIYPNRSEPMPKQRQTRPNAALKSFCYEWNQYAITRLLNRCTG